LAGYLGRELLSNAVKFGLRRVWVSGGLSGVGWVVAGGLEGTPISIKKRSLKEI
jgi:hypothetical protein